MRLKNCIRCDSEINGLGLQRLCATCTKEWKWCSSCETLKPRDVFRLPSGRPIGYCYDPCQLQKGRERNEKQVTKEYHAAFHLKHKFGISMEEAQQLRAVEQCEICGGRPGPDDRLHVDHDHSTGEVRGVLCRWCNYAVGVLEDDRLGPVRDYLREAAKRRLTLVKEVKQN